MTTTAKYKDIISTGGSTDRSEENSSKRTERAATATGTGTGTLDITSDAGLPPYPYRRAGFTMCPNWIYDVLLLEESPSTIKVVLFFNRNTTGRTDLKGHRIEYKQATYKNIASRMKMSERAVGEAMRTALARGYLVQRRHGTGAGEKPAEQSFFEGDFYALNWSWPLNFGTNTELNEPAPNEEKSTSRENNEYSKEGVAATLPNSLYPLPQPTTPNARSSSAAAQPNNFRQDRQNLPGEHRQNLPTCINKAVIKNKEIELKPDSTAPEDISTLPISYQSKKQDISTLNSTDHSICVPIPQLPETKPDEPDSVRYTGQPQQPSSGVSQPSLIVNTVPKRRGSSAIGLLISDLGREFGDGPDLLLPNISRALNLWQTTTLSEKAFLDLIYQARQKARECSSIRHRRTSAVAPLVGSQTNRMPYFFKVLSELSTQTGKGSQPPSNEKEPVYTTSSSSCHNLESSYRPKLTEGDLSAPGCPDHRSKNNHRNIPRSFLRPGRLKLTASSPKGIGVSAGRIPSETAKPDRQEWQSGPGRVEVEAAVAVAVAAAPLAPLPPQAPAEITQGLSSSLTEPSSTFNRSSNRDKDFKSNLSAIWHQVCDALKARFQGGQLAETAQKLNLARGDSAHQLILSAPGLPWLIKSFTSSDIALLRLALRQFTASDFDLILV